MLYRTMPRLMEHRPVPSSSNVLRVPFLFPFLLLVSSSIAARQQQNNSCEDGQVPTGVKVWPDGRPELFCHLPFCSLFSPSFSSSSVELESEDEKENLKASEKQMPNEQKQWQMEDEMGRGEKGPTKSRGRRKDQQRKTHCIAALSASVCELPDEWTVALVEVNNGTHISLLMRCCAVAHLSEWAAPLKSVVLAPGEQFSGGPMLQNGKTVAMDVIKEVRKNVTAQNDVRYVLSVFRVLCASAPPVSPDSDFPAARPIFSHLSGMRLALSDTDSDAASVTVSPGDASRRPSALARHERPSFALMRKAMQKAKEWRRRPLHRNELSSRTNSSKFVADFDATRATQSQTPPDVVVSTTPTTASSSRNFAATAAASTAYTWSTASKSANPSLADATAPNDNNWDEEGSTFSDASSTVPSVLEKVPDQLNVPNAASFTTAMASTLRHTGSGRKVPSTERLRKIGTMAEEVVREGDGRRKYTGLTTIRHRIEGPINSMRDEQRTVKEAEKARRTAKKKPKSFGTAGTYVSPLKNVQLMDIGTTESGSKSEEEEDTLQSVVEQQQQKVDNDELVGLLNAAVSEKAPPPREIAVASAQLSSAGGATAQCAADRTGRSDGCDDGSAPRELILSCGLCSCAQCECSSLPPPCSGPICPICPSVCHCPTECACDSSFSSSSSLSSSNSIQNGVELGESQAVEQPFIPWTQQQQYASGSPQYFYNGQSGYGYSGDAGYGAAGGTALNAAFASLQCFSGEQLVRTARGPVRMDQLRVGDLVLSMDESLVSFSPLLMFLHRKASESATFVRIHTEFGHHLQLTELHLIWVGCAGRLRLIRARELRPGQCVYALERKESNSTEKRTGEMVRTAAGDENRTERVLGRTNRDVGGGVQSRTRMVLSRIVRVDKVHGRGIYAPLTANGNILVNDVLASCHANLAAQTLQQTFFSWWRTLGTFGHKVRSVASVLWPRRSDCAEEQRHADGEDLPMGVRFLITVLDSLMPDSIL